MSTISDAMKKRRDEGDQPSPEAAGPRVVQVEVPGDHTLRNILLGTVLAAIVLAGVVIGGYLVIQQLRSSRPPASEPKAGQAPSPGTTVEGGQETGVIEEPVTTEPEQPAVPELQGIFPDPINPTALLNGRRYKPGAVVEGFTLVAIEEDRVVLEREGTRYELVFE